MLTNKPKKKLLLVGNLQCDNNTNPTVADELEQAFAIRGWQVISTSRKKNKIIKLLDMIQTIFSQRNHYDVAIIDVYSGLALIWAEVTAKLLVKLGKKYVLTLHGGNLPVYSEKHPNRVKNLFMNSESITTPSHFLKNAMSKYGKKIYVVPNPFYIEKYKFIQREFAKPKLVWMRAFHQIYNPMMALSVLQNIKEYYPEINLTMIGPDKQDGTYNQFLAEIEKRKLDQYVLMRGRVSKTDIPNELQKGDIFINTTNIDNTPTSVLEAMACGLCVVSTNVGGIPYLLEDMEDSMLVPANNSVAMSEAVITLLRRPDIVKKLSFAARKKIEKKEINQTMYLWEEIIEEI
jgi:glycosyltransferase involved in cell wall biosynthesis